MSASINRFMQHNVLAELFPPDDEAELERLELEHESQVDIESISETATGLSPEVEPPSEIRPDDAGSGEARALTPNVRLPHGRIVAVANQKGGVGKTTTAISLGAALHEEGARVLLVDFDPQGALSVSLGFHPDGGALTVYDLLLDGSVALEDVVMSTGLPGVDLIPANIELASAEVALASEDAREELLRRCLMPAEQQYNYVLVDCPPSLGLLTMNALTAAHSVLIPLECEYLALRGMALLMDTMDKIKRRLNPDLEILGILPTMLEERTRHSRKMLGRVNDTFEDQTFKTVVHKGVRFTEAPEAGEPILTFAPDSRGAGEYRDLAREVLLRDSGI